MKSDKYKSKFKSDLRQRCFNLSLQVIALVDALPRKRSAWVIGDQVIRSVCSIGANLTEALGSSSRVEFKRYYEMALKSANESKYWLNSSNILILLQQNKLTHYFQNFKRLPV